ncbi:MAG: hypothetical protein ACK5NU_10100 [Fusobacterium ulcerans]
MRITKCSNGLFKVTLKGIEKIFYVKSHHEALEIAFNLGGVQ